MEEGRKSEQYSKDGEPVALPSVCIRNGANRVNEKGPVGFIGDDGCG